MIFDPAKHLSASSTHYDKEAKHYDAFNEERSLIINRLIEKILKQHAVRTILDLTCGTGSQVFYLARQGYEVYGMDINKSMLEIARNKAAEQQLNIHLEPGDMRTARPGKFDAVLTIFNAIGHLTKSDFEKTLQNIHACLNPGGFYLFDIFNLDYLLHEDNITKLTIDWQKKSGEIMAREIQYSTISADGVLASYDIYHEQAGSNLPKIYTDVQTLQVYGAKELVQLLKKNGFSPVLQSDVDGSAFHEYTTERIFTVARKV